MCPKLLVLFCLLVIYHFIWHFPLQQYLGEVETPWDNLHRPAGLGPESIAHSPPSHPICSSISGLERASLHFLLLPSPHASLESAPKAGKSPLPTHQPWGKVSQRSEDCKPLSSTWALPKPTPPANTSLNPQPCALDRFPGSRQKGQGDSRGPSWLPASTAERGSQEARFIPKNKASGDFPRCSWYSFLPFFLLLLPSHPYFSNSLLE